MSISRTAVVGVLLAALIVPTAAAAPEKKPRPKKLTVFTRIAETATGANDIGPAGGSTGDTWFASAPIRDEAGNVVGTRDFSCSVVNDVDAQGFARQMCTVAALLPGKGQIVAEGITVMERCSTASTSIGLCPGGEFNLPVVGGTGKFLGARGIMRSTQEGTQRSATYTYWR